MCFPSGFILKTIHAFVRRKYIRIKIQLRQEKFICIENPVIDLLIELNCIYYFEIYYRFSLATGQVP